MGSIEQREHAFKLIFQIPFHDNINESEVLEFYFRDNEINSMKTKEYINTTFKGVNQNIEKIDSYITKRLNGWSINRINKENLAIIRLAVYELIYNINEQHYVIDDSVKLSKQYGEYGKQGFVNAILRNIALDINNG